MTRYVKKFGGDYNMTWQQNTNNANFCFGKSNNSIYRRGLSKSEIFQKGCKSDQLESLTSKLLMETKKKKEKEKGRKLGAS